MPLPRSLRARLLLAFLLVIGATLGTVAVAMLLVARAISPRRWVTSLETRSAKRWMRRRGPPSTKRCNVPWWRRR